MAGETMTYTEALAWLKDAESKPPEQVDQAKLKAVYKILLEKAEDEAAERRERPDMADTPALQRTVAPPPPTTTPSTPSAPSVTPALMRELPGITALARVRMLMLKTGLTPTSNDVAREEQARLDARFAAGDTIGGTTPTGQAVAGQKEDPVVADFLEAAETLGVSSFQAQQVLSAAIGQVELSGGDLEEYLLAQIQVWEDEARELKGPPIGVPIDYVARRVEKVPPPSAPTGRAFQSDIGGRPIGAGDPTGYRVREVEPQYWPVDALAYGGRGTSTIAKQQKELERAGYLEPGSYMAGSWQDSSRQAMWNAMEDANINGRTVEDEIAFNASLMPDQRKKFEPSYAFVKPDYATLAQEVKTTMRGRLGREPTQAELAELTGFMSSLYRQEYEADVAIERAQFEEGQGQLGLQPSELGAQQFGLGLSRPTSSPELQGVDRWSRFAERFESRFGPEIDRLAALPETRQNMNNVFASLSTMSSLVGGGG